MPAAMLFFMALCPLQVRQGSTIHRYRLYNKWHVGLASLLRPVSNATHTHTGHVPRCDRGTCLEVIAQIQQLLDCHDNDQRAVVCWLNGPAGFGKSALAQTIAECYAAEGCLLGSFFFLQGAGDRSLMSCLIPILAHQISLTVPGAKPLIQSVIEDEPAVLLDYISGGGLVASMTKTGESCKEHQSPGHQLKISLHFLIRLAIHLHLPLH